MSLLALLVSYSSSGQRKIITSDLSYEKGWEVNSDIDQMPGKVISIPMVDSLKHLYVWMGNDSPINLSLMDSICFYEVTGTYTKQGVKATKHLTMVWSDKYGKWGIKIKKFPLWIQFGYRDEKGIMVLSRRYRYATRI